MSDSPVSNESLEPPPVSYFSLLEDYLRAAPFDDDDIFETVIGGAHAGKVKLLLHGGVGIIVKPEDGTPDKSLAVPREEAGWIVARDLGFVTLVSVTVQRSVRLRGSEMNAAVQVLWPDPTPDSAATVHDFSEQQLMAAAIFDVITNHTDHQHNFSAAPAGAVTPRLRLYDNGYAFEFPGRNFSSAFFDEMKNRVIPAPFVKAISHFVDSAPGTNLNQLIGSAAYDKMIERAKRLTETGKVVHTQMP